MNDRKINEELQKLINIGFLPENLTVITRVDNFHAIIEWGAFQPLSQEVIPLPYRILKVLPYVA